MAKSTLAAKLPATMLPLVAVLRNTETVVERPFATAKSGLPSPSKSPRATETGVAPVAVVKSTLAAKLIGTLLPLLDVLLNT